MSLFSRLTMILAATVLFSLTTANNGAAAIHSMTGTSTEASLLSFDANNFALTGGTQTNSSDSRNDLAFDDTGRLFGITSNFLLEFNPSTLQFINQEPFTDNMHGIASRNGTVYSMTGVGTTASLLSFDANNFALTRDYDWHHGEDRID